MKTFGSRAEVMHGTAKKTSGGLVKGDLKYNKWGSIVSRRKSVLANKQKHLAKAGWTAKKGKFGAVCMKKSCKKTAKKMGRKGKGHKGGSGLDSMLKGFMGGDEVSANANPAPGEATNTNGANAPVEETKANNATPVEETKANAPAQSGGDKRRRRGNNRRRTHGRR
jgi:single-stranded DNA-binding protein